MKRLQLLVSLGTNLMFSESALFGHLSGEQVNINMLRKPVAEQIQDIDFQFSYPSIKMFH